MSKYAIRAKNIGPIHSITEGELSEKNQNLIFAKNGMGKSFLSRAFFYLDKGKKREDIEEAPFNLVSEEAPDNTGCFELTYGTQSLGKLTLKTGEYQHDGNVECLEISRIFHVFTEEFIQSELREKEYKINEEIEGAITIGSEKIEIDEKQKEIDELENTLDKNKTELRKKFQNKKQELKDELIIGSRLREYNDLAFDEFLEEFKEKPDKAETGINELSQKLKDLKSIPEDLDLPEEIINEILSEPNLDSINASLEKETSLSSVADEIRSKINENSEFFKAGLELFNKHHDRDCPFCEQIISPEIQSNLIDVYETYFKDAEETHKNELKGFIQNLKSLSHKVINQKSKEETEKTKFNNLKKFIPSQKDIEFENNDIYSKLNVSINEIIDLLIKKINDLKTVSQITSNDLNIQLKKLQQTIYENNQKIEALNKVVKNTTNERLSIQREACGIFKYDFVFDKWKAIDDLEQKQVKINDLKSEIETLRSKGPTKLKKDRFSNTFNELLEFFFNDKYKFNKETFEITRESNLIRRSLTRTLSDGEKTALAFCYFIASIHLKVDEAADYKKLFLVFDDPITSMSFDYIYSIVQVLKDLRIKYDGNVSIVNISAGERPDFLVLTHSSYFFNVCVTSKAINNNAYFYLEKTSETHSLSKMEKYITPFEDQIRHVYKVDKGSEAPNFYTGNSIRAILETIGKFCLPNRFENFQTLKTYFQENGFTIRSSLLNSASHGQTEDEVISSDDLKQACKETIEIVRKFAPGQIELLETS